jgi:hypothetical protein
MGGGTTSAFVDHGIWRPRKTLLTESRRIIGPQPSILGSRQWRAAPDRPGWGGVYLTIDGFAGRQPTLTGPSVRRAHPDEAMLVLKHGKFTVDVILSAIGMRSQHLARSDTGRHSAARSKCGRRTRAHPLR